MNIFWFRRDLRLDDNVGLFHALNADEEVLPIFIFDETILSQLPKDDARVTFIHNQLEKIQKQLQEIGKSLAVFHGKPLDVYQKLISENANRNKDFFDTEMDKLDQWADDMKISLEKEIKDLDAEIKLRKAEAKKMLNLETKVSAQRIIKDMEKKRNEKRQLLYTAQDEIDEKKENLLTDIEKMLKQKIEQKEVFTIKWKII